jgi:hypothetical protein
MKSKAAPRKSSLQFLNLLRSLEFCAHGDVQRQAYSQYRQEKIWLVFTTRDLRLGAVVLTRVLELAPRKNRRSSAPIR